MTALLTLGLVFVPLHRLIWRDHYRDHPRPTLPSSTSDGAGGPPAT